MSDLTVERQSWLYGNGDERVRRFLLIYLPNQEQEIASVEKNHEGCITYEYDDDSRCNWDTPQKFNEYAEIIILMKNCGDNFEEMWNEAKDSELIGRKSS